MTPTQVEFRWWVIGTTMIVMAAIFFYDMGQRAAYNHIRDSMTTCMNPATFYNLEVDPTKLEDRRKYCISLALTGYTDPKL